MPSLPLGKKRGTVRGGVAGSGMSRVRTHWGIPGGLCRSPDNIGNRLKAPTRESLAKEGVSAGAEKGESFKLSPVELLEFVEVVA